MAKCIFFCGVLTWLTIGFLIKLEAQEVVGDTLISLELTDGSVLKGNVQSENSDTLEFRLSSGISLNIPKTIIAARNIAHGRIVDGKFQRTDPNYTRLLFTPTGRPLKKGEGYFTDYYVFFPGVAYGITDNFSVMAGLSLLPAMDFSDQMFYIAPRIGVNFSQKLALSGGLLYMSAGNEFSSGVTFVTATYGLQEKCFTAGFGLGFTSEEGDFEFAKNPIFVWGGNIRLSNSIAFVSENWIFPGKNFDVDTQPVSIAVRFFGEHIAVDLGTIILLEILEEGFPIPWLSFVYNFGG